MINHKITFIITLDLFMYIYIICFMTKKYSAFDFKVFQFFSISNREYLLLLNLTFNTLL
jgi:hypothetical protein